jgi:predicted ATPase
VQPGDVIAERFEIERFAGSGGMGAVYRAKDRTSGQSVAVKTLITARGQDVERFTREAALLAELRHPGIVRYVAHGTTVDGSRYLAMEWLEGVDLADHLANRGALSPDEAVRIARHAADALAVAHARGVVHRDIKPSNIFLADGRVDRLRLLDFGVARLPRASTNTRAGAVIGTPGYMAPEQARGEQDVDPRADVFALGCVLFECLTGRPVFVADHPMALLAKIIIEEAPELRSLVSGIDPAVDKLVRRMLAKPRDQRPSDGAAVVMEIDGLGGTVTLSGDAPPVPALVALTSGEQRLLCVVIVGGPPAATADEATAPTMLVRQDPSTSQALRDVVDAHGGRLEPLADGSSVITFSGVGSATDQVARAARCALALRKSVPEPAIALATGRGVVADRWPVGEVIERAVRLVRLGNAARGAHPSPVRIDEVTGGLLDPRFEVGGDADGLLLQAEREGGKASRTLLGQPTPMVGREVEVGTLEATFAECAEESMARAVLVTAAAGVGKSRLRHEFLQRVTRSGRQADVWLARGDPMTAGAPFAMLAQALRGAIGIRDGEPAMVRQRKLRARVARGGAQADAQRITEFLGELIGVPFPDVDSVQLQAARGDAMLMGDQMARAWIDFVTAECAAGPVIVVLEDLHWGDLPTIKLVEMALRSLEDQPLFVLALARPEVQDQFPKLWAGRGLTRLELGELSRKAAERLVRHVLGKSTPAQVVTRIVEHAAGNAFYLEELIRSVHEGKTESLPETVIAMVQARLEGLAPEARRVMRAGSVFGQVFWAGAVRALLGGDGTVDHQRWLEHLVEHEMLTTREPAKFPGEQELAFRHALLGEAAYAMLTDADRQVGHRLAGEWLAEAGESEPMILAEHFERGGLPAQAVPWFLRAAAQALEGNDFAAAIARAERGIGCNAVGMDRAALRLVQAEAHGWRGELAEDETCAMEALEHAPVGGGLRLEAYGLAAMASGRLGRVDRLVELAERLRAELDATTIDAAAVVASARIAQRLLVAGQFNLAEALHEQIRAAAATLAEKNPFVAARIHQLGFSRAMAAGDSAGNIEHGEAAAAALERIGALRDLCSTRANLGSAYADLGRYDQAEALLRAAKATAEQLGLRGTSALASHNLGRVLARRGKLADARAVEQSAVEAYRALGNRRMEGGSRIYLAMIAELAGDLPVAEREARQAVDTLSVAPPVQCYALAMLSDVLRRADRFGEALDVATRASSLLGELGQIDAGEALVRLVHAEAYHQVGQLDAARNAIVAARDRLLERAAKINDAHARRSFLEAVPDNARTLELAAAWSGQGRPPATGESV